MKDVERSRERVSGMPSADYLRERMASGWRLVALEWERDKSAPSGGGPRWRTEVPFGLRIGSDCLHLEENPSEVEAMTMAMELIVQDRNLSEVAAALNQAGHRTRSEAPWTAGTIFDLLPRLIEAGPHIFSSSDWPQRRDRLARAV